MPDENMMPGEADVTNAISAEQWRVNELRKLGNVGEADRRQAALTSREFERGIRSQLGVAEPATLPPAAPGHSATVKPDDFAGTVSRDYHHGALSNATVAELGDLASQNSWSVEAGRPILQRIIDLSVSFKNMDTSARTNWVAQQQQLAANMAPEHAAKWRDAAVAAMSKTPLGKAVISSGLVEDVWLQRMCADLAAAAESFKK